MNIMKEIEYLISINQDKLREEIKSLIYYTIDDRLQQTDLLKIAEEIQRLWTIQEFLIERFRIKNLPIKSKEK